MELRPGMSHSSETACSNAAKICQRLRKLRLEMFGPRGRSRFARELGIGVSTYSNYENHRLPPATLLLRAAEVTGASLQWLVSGKECPSDDALAAGDQCRELLIAVERVISQQPDLLPQLAEYVRRLDAASNPLSTSSAKDRQSAGLIPLVGSTAAGPARFWSEVSGAAEGQQVDSRLEALLEELDSTAEIRPGNLSSAPARSAPQRVSLIQFANPDEEGLLEFVDAPAVWMRHPRAVAWRIDGDSMSPRFADGDLVLTSPEHPAIENQPCVARQAGQIGVNCKLYRREGDDVLLIPINERHRVQRVEGDSLIWAWRVLCSVRLN